MFYFIHLITTKQYYHKKNSNTINTRLYNILFFHNHQKKNFYIVEKTGNNITPISKTIGNNGELTLIFSQKKLENILSNGKIYKFEKAFTGTNSQLLKRTYILNIDDNPVLINQLNEVAEIELIENIPDPIPLSYPNDINMGNIGNDRALELVRAPMAWEITTGNPNIFIGIPDTSFNTNHEDLNSKIVQHFGLSTLNGLQHGTMVSGYAAANTNNQIGVASIEYNTRLITAEGASLMKVHELAQIPGIRVINTSWVSSCTYNAIDEEVLREVWEDFGIVVVSAAGNGGTCNLPPSSYIYTLQHITIIQLQYHHLEHHFR